MLARLVLKPISPSARSTFQTGTMVLVLVALRISNELEGWLSLVSAGLGNLGCNEPNSVDSD